MTKTQDETQRRSGASQHMTKTSNILICEYILFGAQTKGPHTKRLPDKRAKKHRQKGHRQKGQKADKRAKNQSYILM